MPMDLKLFITGNGKEFDETPATVIAELLRTVAAAIANGEAPLEFYNPILDADGKTVGSYRLTQPYKSKDSQ